MNTNNPNRSARTTTAQVGIVAPAAAVALALLLNAAAQAQPVRKCLIDNRVVFQSSPCPPEARIASAAPQAIANAPAIAPKKKTLAELLHERDSADPATPHARQPQSDGANVLRSRMGAV